ncbi:hypothetical protein C8F04DRAFT_645167 [Mycena alexandri]|uniref:Uncharacterized protein n=1 Tax=Mycena alexandri TaxID=1745969 RepID=A0AAD6STF6_9AGAR|nr:hypothetical protein C8F04DRAFT_645167 [Mycena alexandri]
MPSHTTSYKWQIATGIAKIAIPNPPGQDISFAVLWQEVRNNAVTYCRPAPAPVPPPSHYKAPSAIPNIIGTRFLLYAKKWLREYRNRKLVTVDFDQETFQLTPKGDTKFNDIRNDVGDTSNMDGKAVVAAYFFACKKHIGSLKSLTKAELDAENDRQRHRIRILQNEKAILQLQVENLQESNAGHSDSEQLSKHTTPRKARSEGPYQLPTPESIPHNRGRRLLSSPPSPSPHGTAPMDVDDDDGDLFTPKNSVRLSPTNSAMSIDQSGLHPQPYMPAEEELTKLRAEVTRLEAENAYLNARLGQYITELEKCKANVKDYEDQIAELQSDNAHIDEDLRDALRVGYFQAREAMQEANDELISANNALTSANNALTSANNALTSANDVLKREVSAANIRAAEANASIVQLTKDNTALEAKVSVARKRAAEIRRKSDLATKADADFWDTL